MAKKTKKTSTRSSRRKPTNDPVTQYALDVTSGKEIAGPYVRLACQRHLDDLENGEKRGLHFVSEDAVHKINFFKQVLTVESDGEFVPFQPHPSQQFIIGSLYGWWREIKTPGKAPSKWVRRFRTFYGEQGKGNGKSPMAAGVGINGFVADGELGAEVYFAATKKDQAMIAFRDAVKMRDNSPHLANRIGKSGGVNVWQMYHTPSSSFMKPLSKDGAHSGPRPNVVIIDEYHEQKTADMLEMLEAGFKARTNPLLFIITNSGSDKSSPCGVMHDFCVKILKGEIEKEDKLAADQVFAYICALDEGDDPLKDKTCWKKANPLLGITIKHDYLEKQVAAARAMPAKQNKVLRLNFCVWTDAADAWISREVWEACESDAINWEAMRGRECYIGCDLSFTTDMSALAFVFPDDQGGYDCFVEYWRPEDGLKEAVDRDKVRYDLWHNEGFVNLTPGKVIKLGPIGERIAEAMDAFDVRALCYDRYRHKELAENLADLGVVPPMIEHPQGFRRSKVDSPFEHGKKVDNPLWMPSSCQELENSIIEERFRVFANSAMRWNVSSAVIREDPAGTDNWIFDKRRARGRIDGLVAAAMAVGGAKYLGEWTPPTSPYEDETYSLMSSLAED